MAFDNLRLEKGMYGRGGRSFSDLLEELDPTAGYRGTELGGLDAYQRQLKRFDIRVSGPSSDPVEKFFQNSDSAVLFPEYIARAVRAGKEEQDVLSKVIATKTMIDTPDYRTISSVPTEEDLGLKRVAQGAVIPETSIRTQNNLVTLHKRGRMLVASYEAIRYQRLDLFTVTLRQIGAAIAKSQLADAIEVLIEGDGNNNAIETVTVSGDFGYDHLVSLWSALDPYELRTILAAPDRMVALLSLQEMHHPICGSGFEHTGRLVTPLGAQLVQAKALSSGKIIGLDSNCALEMVCADDVSIEYDKLIDRQLERAAITATAGFAKIFPDAAKMLG